MATDPNVPDDTQWPGLLNDANNGTLFLKDGTAQTCAQFCETLLEAVLGMQSWIQSNFTPLPPSSDLPSGAQLATAFNTLHDTELMERLGRHANILTDMGNTFVAAGKAYQQAEDSSAANFAGINFDDPPATIPTYVPPATTTPASTGTPEIPNLPSSSVIAGVTIPAENPDSLSWGDLYNVGQSIDAQIVADQAGTWHWISQTLRTAFMTFVQQVNSASSSWSGTGAQTAVTASANYGTDATRLTNDMDAVGDILTYTSGWLQQTKENMPVSPVPPTTNVPVSIDGVSYDVSAGLALFRQNFSNVYAVGLAQTTSHMPELSQPYTANSLEPQVGSGTNGTNDATPNNQSTAMSSRDGVLAADTGQAPSVPADSASTSHQPADATSTPSDPTGGTSSLGVPAAATTSAASDPTGDTSALGVPAAATTSAASDPTGGTSALGVPAAATTSAPGDPTGGTSALGVPAAATTSAPSDPVSPIAVPAASAAATTSPAATTASPTTTAPPGSLGSLGSLLPTAATAQPLAKPTIPAANTLADAAKAEKQALNAIKAGAAKDLAGAGAGGGGGAEAGPAEPVAAIPGQAAESSKLFPRASAPEESVGRAGAADAAEGEGIPGGPMGGAGAGRGNQDKEKKRAGYLDSVVHLDEAIGKDPLAVRAVLDR